VFVVLQCKFKKGDKRDQAGDKERKSPTTTTVFCTAYTSGATYTQFPDSCALRCVLRGKSETVSCRDATGCAGSVAFRVGQKETPEKYRAIEKDGRDLKPL